MEFLPNPFYIKARVKCEIHRKVEDAGFECLTVNNNGQFIIVIGAFLFLKILVAICRFLVEKARGPGNKDKAGTHAQSNNCPEETKKTFLGSITESLIKNIVRLTSWHTLVVIFISLQIDILISICIFLQVKYYSSGLFIRNEKGEIQDSLSIGLTFYYLIAYGFITGGVIYSFFQFLRNSVGARQSGLKVLPIQDGDDKFKGLNVQNRQSESIKTGMFSSFYNDINSSSKIGSIYILISYFRDLIIPLLIISFTWRPRWQYYTVTLFMLVKLVYLAGFRPFDEAWKNFMEVVNDSLYFMVLGLNFVLLEFGEDLTPFTKYYYVGYPIIILIFTLFTVNIANQIKQSIQTIIYLLYRKKPELLKPPQPEEQLEIKGKKYRLRNKRKNRNKSGNGSNSPRRTAGILSMNRNNRGSIFKTGSSKLRKKEKNLNIKIKLPKVFEGSQILEKESLKFRREVRKKKSKLRK